MKTNIGTVVLVDDDPLVAVSLSSIIDRLGHRRQTFPDGASFLAAIEKQPPAHPACVLLDLRMPNVDGLQVQRAVEERRLNLPIIFMSAFIDTPSVVSAMKRGAINFLPKPFNSDTLAQAIDEALQRAMAMEKVHAQHELIGRRLETLTDREREVLEQVVSGLTNKAVGTKFGISEKTVKVHRGRVMEKMGAGSLAELVLMAQAVGIPTAQLSGIAPAVAAEATDFE